MPAAPGAAGVPRTVQYSFFVFSNLRCYVRCCSPRLRTAPSGRG